MKSNNRRSFVFAISSQLLRWSRARSMREASSLHAPSIMGIEISSLLHRDHEDIDKSLLTLLDRAKSLGQIRTALDGVRLCLTAHAEAEDIVLSRAIRARPPVLKILVDESAHAHRLQEIALASLTCTPLGSREWYSRCETLLGLVRQHARYEEDNIMPALHELVPDIYPGLAGKFATERMRQLSMLMPSAPLVVARAS